MKTSPQHDRRLAELKAWFASLPEGAAVLEVMRSPAGDEAATRVDIRPIRAPRAADIRVRIERRHGYTSIGAGEGYRAEGVDWGPEGIPLERLCGAIAAGGLTVEVRLWKGRETGTRARLAFPDGTTPEQTDDIRWLRGEIARLTLGAVRPGKGKRLIHYPPY